jgi:hypothetical protein
MTVESTGPSEPLRVPIVDLLSVADLAAARRRDL